MKRFVEGEDRRQGVLLPEFLDEYASDENPVRVIGLVQENLHTGQSTLSPENLTTLSMEMRRHLAGGPHELRQAYMRLLLDHVMVGHYSVRPEGSPAILEKLASRGPPALVFL